MRTSCFNANVPSHRVTPPEVYFSRRQFLTAFGACAIAGPGLLESVQASRKPKGALTPPYDNPHIFPAIRNKDYNIPVAIKRKALTPREIAATHNNFYEFLPGQGGPVWKHTDKFKVRPWEIEIKGACHKPQVLDLDNLLAFGQQERVYHFRCVERWAMNVPWTGFPLSKLLNKVEPKSSAKFVRFQSALDRSQMPGVQKSEYYPWPYEEALRIDEAMNPLALVATGIYGEPLLKQHGAPVRIVVPWKYGYKNPKSIVCIELLEKQPKTFWQIQPHEYGFLSNVNPNIPHPRWSQAQSHWLDTDEPFETPLFNGYAEQVSGLYPDEPQTEQAPLQPGQLAR